VTTRGTRITVDELCCAEEERRIHNKLSSLEGVEEISVDVLNQTVCVDHVCPEGDLTTAIRELGFTPRFSHDADTDKNFWQQYRQHVSTAAGALLLAVGFAFRWVDAPPVAADAFLILSIAVSGWRIILRGVKAAVNLTPDMNLLMTVAAAGAVAIGKNGEGAAVMVLFSLAHLLELHSLAYSRRAIRSLMKDAPAKAVVRRNGVVEEVGVEDVRIGEHVVVKPAESIPLDGTVVSGISTVNQSMITGESVPVTKQNGDTVFAGSLNGRGILEFQTTNLATDSTIARIIAMVERSQSKRAEIHAFADRFAYYYTPAVMMIAVLIAVVPPLVTGGGLYEWIYRSLVLLVIACPCALVISTPVTIVSGLALAAKKGVLIKGGRYLEEIGRIRSFAFDKTGTLTRGIPVVTDIIPLGGLETRRVLETAAVAESNSEHHFAGAVLARARAEGVTITGAGFDDFVTIPGRGVRAVSGNDRIFIGNHAFIEEEGLCSAALEKILHSIESEGKSAVVTGRGSTVEGVLGIRDEVRPESSAVLSTLHRTGVRKTIMITGDNANTARAIAGAIGIDEVHAEVLPDRKSEIVENLRKRYGTVAMVGDGVNDAPALASATVGVAMGGTGTDVALETADIILMSDDLSNLPLVRSISRRTLAIVKQNIVLALSTKAVFLTLGAMGMASLWTAVLADDGAAIVVILNGLRALRWNGDSETDAGLRETRPAGGGDR
jgi:Cd2+/Zn2+-exporting ATPase